MLSFSLLEQLELSSRLRTYRVLKVGISSLEFAYVKSNCGYMEYFRFSLFLVFPSPLRCCHVHCTIHV